MQYATRFAFIGLVIALVPTAAASAAEPTPDDPAEVVAAARAILDDYHRAGPVPVDRRLQVVCWRCRDRDFPAAQHARLDRILTHIQAFYAREMQRHGFGEASIRLDRDADGRLVVHEVVGEGRYDDYATGDGRRIRDECLPVLREAGIDAAHETIMIFTNLAEWDPEKRVFRHKSPYYAGGSAASGTAWQLDSPELDTANLPLTEPTITDGQYGRISLGKHNSIFIGGIAHELGHALGLPHCRERPDEASRGTALMGGGNRTYGDEIRGEGKGSFLTLAHALRLASHPQFSGSAKALRAKATAEFTELAVDASDSGRAFIFSGTVASDPPVYAVVAYLDPEGHSDYDARTVVAVPDAEGRFTLRCNALVAGKPAELRIVFCHANGATSQLRYPYAVAADGQVEIAAIRVPLALRDFLAAADTAEAKAQLEQLAAGSDERRIAAAILAGRSASRATLPASDVPADTESYPLSRITPAEATVGWGRPAYDHLSRREAILLGGGEIFETGIYAHAPALHRYDLAGAGFRRLEGACGLAGGSSGSVVFVIRADGREVFRSDTIRAGGLERFAIDLAQVKSLELLTEDAGDGKGSDWGVWFGPLLRR